MHTSTRAGVLGRLFLVLTAAATLVPTAGAQSGADSAFSARAVWPATLGPQAATDLRTGTGHPGPSDWKNHAAYRIEARLDTSARSLMGRVTIQYTNNSPSPLSSLWLIVGPPRSTAIEIQTISVSDGSAQYEPTTIEAGGRRQVRLRQPVAGGGGTVTLTLRYSLALRRDTVPGWTSLPSGDLYGLGEWCPRVAAYSSEDGWASAPSPSASAPLGAYGSFKYAITVPARFILAGSGTLMNPNDVLTADQRRRLMRARDSRQKVAIITPNQAGTPDTRPTQSGTLTWRFQMNGVRNVGWAASPAFIWNGAKFSRPGKRDGLAMSYYPPSALGGEAWNRSTYHTQKTVGLFSRSFYAYPWNNAVSVVGPGRNKGLPGFSMCSPSATGAALFGCVVRNQSYNWFPGIVGSDLNQHPWMAHALRAFATQQAHRRIYDGEFARQEAALLPSPSAVAKQLGEAEAPILAPPSLDANGSFALREKPAVGLHLLREYVLGPERFDYALHQYAQRWAFRVATPRDFFRTIADASGDDLSWFWRGWYASTWSMDLAVTSVSYRDDTPEAGAEIGFSLQRPMPMPVRATVVEADGDTLHLHLPVEVWRAGAPHESRVDTDSRLKRVTVDPDRHLPDANRANNTWTATDP